MVSLLNDRITIDKYWLSMVRQSIFNVIIAFRARTYITITSHMSELAFWNQNLLTSAALELPRIENGLARGIIMTTCLAIASRD